MHSPPEFTAAAPDLIPYGRQDIGDDDIAAVVETLRSDWLTTGPNVSRFEQEFAAVAGTRQAVAVSNGTVALLAMLHALDLQPGDEVIVPTLTFSATANAVVLHGATPVFADVQPDTLLLDPASVREKINPRTRAVIAVDYAGHPCDYDSLNAICGEYGINLLADACHALGATLEGLPAGSLAAMSAFSFHPVKAITTGEGGMVTTDDDNYAHRLRRYRNHGIDLDFRARSLRGVSSYDIVENGINGRLSDLQCALGLSQLKKLPGFLARRRKIAASYDRAFAAITPIRPLATRPGAEHAYHLYVVRVPLRDRVLQSLRERGIQAGVHYPPVHLFTRYREKFGTGPGLLPVAEQAASEILSLPIYPLLSDDQVNRVIEALTAAVQ